jgi:hypothetical protein
MIKPAKLALIFKRAMPMPHDPIEISQIGIFRSIGHSSIATSPLICQQEFFLG